MTARQFVESYFEAAYKAYIKYGIHPVATLAQAAKESGWGTATNVQKANNFFGMTKGGALLNEYWFGQYRTAASGLKFRVYPSPTNSFLDFGRVIAKNYPDSAAVSHDLESYAAAISRSKYLSAADNRESYRRDLISIGNKLADYVECMMSKKQPSADTTPTAPDNTNGFSGLDCATSCPLTTETNDASGKEINLVKIALWITVLVVVPGGIALYLLKKK